MRSRFFLGIHLFDTVDERNMTKILQYIVDWYSFSKGFKNYVSTSHIFARIFTSINTAIFQPWHGASFQPALGDWFPIVKKSNMTRISKSTTCKDIKVSKANLVAIFSGTCASSNERQSASCGPLASSIEEVTGSNN